MALHLTLDKSVYAPGDLMTLTVATDPHDRDTFRDTPVTVHVDVPGLGGGDATGTLRSPAGPAPVAVSDASRPWSLVSDDGQTAVYSATA